ncbi:hypothetical protein D9M69_495360 [compost metagenome]
MTDRFIRTIAQITSFAIQFNDLDLDSRQSLANGANQAFTMNRIHGAGTSRLGKAIALQQPNACRALETAHQFG